MSTPLAFSTTALRKRYGVTVALDGLALAVPAGAIHGPLRPNGTDRTTEVGIPATPRHADSGAAPIAGFDVCTQGAEVRRRIGLVGQAQAVDDMLGGRQKLVMFAGLAPAAARAMADALLMRCGLVQAAAKPVWQYSGGMRRRFDIIARCSSPAVLFLDEHSTGVAPEMMPD